RTPVTSSPFPYTTPFRSNLGSYLDGRSAYPIVVAREITRAAGGKVRIDFKIFTSKISNRGIDQFNEIMRQYLAGKAYGNALNPLDRKSTRLNSSHVSISY